MLAEKPLLLSFFVRMGGRELTVSDFFGLNKVFPLLLMHGIYSLVNLHPEKKKDFTSY